MQPNPVAHSPACVPFLAHQPVRVRASANRAVQQARTRDQQFIFMIEAYRNTGGIARSDEINHWIRRSGGPDPAALNQWIDNRTVLCFEWNDARWMPWFQFNRHTLHPHPQLAPLLAELAAVFDPWETANWFAMPSAWIGGRAPVDCLLSDMAGVLDAARADRFVANG